MELKIISSEDYNRIIDKIDEVIQILKEQNKESKKGLSEKWLDSSEVLSVLKISSRTLQNYRDQRLIPFSKIGSKIYYKASDIEKYLNDHYSA